MTITLAGSSWVLIGPTPEVGAPETLTDLQVSAEFDAERVSGMSGCNRYTGGYTLEGDRLTFGALAGTRMMCGDDAMAVEAEVLRRLAAVTVVSVVDSLMTMLDDDGELLVFTRV